MSQPDNRGGPQHKASGTGRPEDLQALSLLGQLLLTTDGTVTDILQLATSEGIAAKVRQFSAKSGADSCDQCLMELDDTSIERWTDLIGDRTSRTFVRAQSYIRLSVLPISLQDELTDGRVPIGKLMKKYRIESYREIIHCFVDLNRGANDEVTGALLRRTYRIYVRQEPAFLVNEKFSSASLPLLADDRHHAHRPTNRQWGTHG